MADMSATGRTIGDYVSLFRRRWIYPAIILPGVLLLAIFLAYALPPEFRSTGTILLEPSSIPDNIVQSTVTSYADEQMEIVRQRVMTTEKLEQIITEHDPYPDLGSTSPAAKARQIAADTEIERVDPITLEPLEKSTAFSIHYNNPDPKIAKDMADQLVALFLSYNRQTRTERAQATHGFLQAESRRLGDDIRGMEQRLAEFKAKHGEGIPENNTRNLLQADRLDRDLMDVEGQVRAAQEREQLLAVQLADTSPMLFDSAGDWRTELAAMKVELADAQRRYTPNHPDVKRLKRSIEALGARVAAAGPETKSPDNPEYLHVQSQLQAARAELSALRADATRLRNQLQGYHAAIAAAPEVGKEYADLQRDYEIAQDQFKDIQGKLQAAAIAETLETEQRGERFTLIRSPQMPTAPFFPNRLGMILLGLVLAVALSVGLAALAESSDPSVRGTRDVSDLTDVSVIGAVPVVLNPQDVRKRALAWGMASAAFAVALLIVGVTVAQA